MSRIGKKLIEIPEGVTVSFDKKERVLSVTGPNGGLERKLRSEVEVSISDGNVSFNVADESIFSRALWGTYASHTINMIEGVRNLFEKKLVVEGVGYTVEVSGGELTLKVGYSHPVKFSIPEGLDVSTEKNVIIVKGIDKELVGGFCAKVRSSKKPEPYKGKGIRYDDEVVRRKQGKRAA